MADATIEYLTKTWSPIQTVIKGESGQGYHCTKVDEGCRECWAEGMNNRFGNKLPFDAKELKFEIKKSELYKPFSWRKPQRIGVQFMGDLFHKDIPFGYLHQIFTVMLLCQEHQFFVLTKRPERLAEYLKMQKQSTFIEGSATKIFLKAMESKEFLDWVDHKIMPSNIWFGTSISDQPSADKRIPELLKIKLQFPHAKLWLSVEPLLGEINLLHYLTNCYIAFEGSVPNPEQLEKVKAIMKNYFKDTPELLTISIKEKDEIKRRLIANRKIDWVIVGGESGAKARPMHTDWVRKIRDDCKAAGVPFMFKQWGEFLPIDQQLTGGIGKYYDENFTRCGKRNAGRLLDEVEHNACPTNGKKE